MERKTRGRVLNGYLDFIENEWGASTRKVATADIGIDSMDWSDGQYYQDEIVDNILRWIRRNKGEDAVKKAGRAILHNLGILSWMVRFSDVETIAKKFPKNFSEIYAFGSCSVEISQKDRVKLILKDVVFYEERCMVWIGICEEVLAITKTEGKVTHPKCQLKGDDVCEYIIEY